MRSLAVLYGGNLTKYAFEPVLGKCALERALEGVRLFPGCDRTALLTGAGFDALAAGWRCPEGVELVAAPVWTQRSLLESLAALSGGFDLTWFAWADAPFLDPALAAALAERHLRYAAEYSYADGWPYGLAPELLAPGVAGILAKLADESPVDRESLFQVIRKDINAFDIETEIAPADLRPYRLSLTADSKRNALLVARLAGAGLDSAAAAERIITGQPELLRTLPAFYAVQAAGACPQSCAFCPYPRTKTGAAAPAGGPADFVDAARFEALLDRIAAFSGDAVIDLSLWGELSLHPRKLDLIRMVLARPDLSLIVETSGLSWTGAELEEVAAIPRPVQNRPWGAPAGRLSWIVSLDAADEARYAEVRGAGFAAATETARTLLRCFPGDTYVQALRIRGAEDDTERFYRRWKEIAGAERVIVQKYDDFAGALPKLQGADISPVRRRPCWHLLRDMNIFMDGRVPSCREDLAALDGGAVLGNAFEEDLAALWDRGKERYREHCSGEYRGLCADCDEYYTFNF